MLTSRLAKPGGVLTSARQGACCTVTFRVSDTVQEGDTVEGAENKEGMREDAPRIEGFLGRGSPVTVSARTGVDLEGYVCDQNESGLLLDARDSSGDPTGYEFLPWSSIERVSTG
jgi:hypothetical protein